MDWDIAAPSAGSEDSRLVMGERRGAAPTAKYPAAARASDTFLLQWVPVATAARLFRVALCKEGRRKEGWSADSVPEIPARSSVWPRRVWTLRIPAHLHLLQVSPTQLQTRKVAYPWAPLKPSRQYIATARQPAQARNERRSLRRCACPPRSGMCPTPAPSTYESLCLSQRAL